MKNTTNTIALTDDTLKNITGGNLACPPDQYILDAFGLGDIVQSTGGWVFTDDYYDTKRSDGWKNVGSEDMLKYVARTIGTNDPRYIALYEYSWKGATFYDREWFFAPE